MNDLNCHGDAKTLNDTLAKGLGEKNDRQGSQFSHDDGRLCAVGDVGAARHKAVDMAAVRDRAWKIAKAVADGKSGRSEKTARRQSALDKADATAGRLHKDYDLAA